VEQKVRPRQALVSPKEPLLAATESKDDATSVGICVQYD
jgi:hypothetical protein